MAFTRIRADIHPTYITQTHRCLPTCAGPIAPHNPTKPEARQTCQLLAKENFYSEAWKRPSGSKWLHANRELAAPTAWMVHMRSAYLRFVQACRVRDVVDLGVCFVFFKGKKKNMHMVWDSEYPWLYSCFHQCSFQCSPITAVRRPCCGRKKGTFIYISFRALMRLTTFAWLFSPLF